MNYIVLSAGVGSRMGRLGAYLQKAMYPILDKPFLEYLLDSIRRNKYFSPSCDTIIIVLGHLKKQVVDYFGDAYEEIPIKYCAQESPTGTADAFLVGRRAGNITEPSIVMQGDCFVAPDDIETLIENPFPNALSLVEHHCEATHVERVDVAGKTIKTAWMGSGPYIDAALWKLCAELELSTGPGDREHRFLESLQREIDRGLEVGFEVRNSWVHLGGTEPSVRENIVKVYKYFLQ